MPLGQLNKDSMQELKTMHKQLLAKQTVDNPYGTLKSGGRVLNEQQSAQEPRFGAGRRPLEHGAGRAAPLEEAHSTGRWLAD